MKKVISLILFCILISTSALAFSEKDICFLGIPWLSSIEDTIQLLYEKGYLRAEKPIIQLNEGESYYLKVEDTGEIWPFAVNRNDYCASIRLDQLVNGRIAGYPVSNITMTYVFDGEYRLLLAKIELLGIDLSDIRDKLLRVYGECEEFKRNNDTTYVWKDSNNAGIVLYTYYDGQAFDLCYGRIDAEDILSECMKPADPDDVSGL